MKYLSLCSGIEAASQAWHSLGWKPVAFSEIEPFPSAVLKHHYPSVPNLGDMTKFHEWPSLRIQLLVGGTPCQSFSVAGLRKGLDDDRGNLALKYVDIAARYRPRWIVWENVPGVFSSAGGADFASFLGALSGRDIRPPGEGWRNSGTVAGIPDAYGLAWRTLDAQHFGVAQQRRRVFVIGYLGDWRRAAAALFETACLRRDTAPRRRTRPQTAARPSCDAESGGIAGTIGRSYEKGHGRTGGANGGVARGHLIPASETSLCLNAGAMGRQDSETETMVAHVPELERACALSATGVGTCGADDNQAQAGHLIAAPLTAAPYADRGAGDESKLVPVPDPMTKTGDKVSELLKMERERKRRALKALAPTPIQPIPKPRPPLAPIPFDPVQITSPENRSNPKPGSASPTLAAQEKAPCIAFEPRERGDDGRGDSAPCVAVTLHGSHERVRAGATETEVSTALRTSPPGEISNSSTTVALQRAGVRRLTARECERLQGFPDDYTLIPRLPGHPARQPDDYAETVHYLIAAGWADADARILAHTPDGPRYKAIGNSMAVPVMAWLGRRIALVDSIP